MTNKEKVNILRMLAHIRERVTALDETLKYYSRLEEKNQYLSTDQQISYTVALARYNELVRLLDFVETGE